MHRLWALGTTNSLRRLVLSSVPISHDLPCIQAGITSCPYLLFTIALYIYMYECNLIQCKNTSSMTHSFWKWKSTTTTTNFTWKQRQQQTSPAFRRAEHPRNERYNSTRHIEMTSTVSLPSVQFSNRKCQIVSVYKIQPREEQTQTPLTMNDLASGGGELLFCKLL